MSLGVLFCFFNETCIHRWKNLAVVYSTVLTRAAFLATPVRVIRHVFTCWVATLSIWVHLIGLWADLRESDTVLILFWSHEYSRKHIGLSSHNPLKHKQSHTKTAAGWGLGHSAKMSNLETTCEKCLQPDIYFFLEMHLLWSELWIYTFIQSVNSNFKIMDLVRGKQGEQTTILLC